MDIFHVVTANREPEGDRLRRVPRVYGDKTVLRTAVSREQQRANSLISIPVVEEEEFSASDVWPVAPNSQKLSDQLHQLLADGVIEEIPTQGPEQ